MAVITKYIVERNGVEKMTFSSKPEADAYDKMLDIAEELFVLLGQSELFSDEQQQDDLALYLARNKEAVMACLNQKTKPAKAQDKAQEKTSGKMKEKIVALDASPEEEQAA